MDAAAVRDAIRLDKLDGDRGLKVRASLEKTENGNVEENKEVLDNQFKQSQFCNMYTQAVHNFM